MSTPLPEQTRRTLLSIASATADVDGIWWASVAPYHGSSLTALEQRGLVEMDRYMGRVRLTDAGREAARELKGDGA